MSLSFVRLCFASALTFTALFDPEREGGVELKLRPANSLEKGIEEGLAVAILTSRGACKS